MNVDPQAILKEVSDELKEAQEKAGLGGADAIVQKLEEIKTKAQAGPGDLVDNMKAKFAELMSAVDEAMNDPASLMGGGPLAACASYFAKQVLDKLKALKEEMDKVMSSVADMAKSLAKSFKDLGEALGKVMEALGKQMKKLMGLPQELQDVAGTVSGPEDFGKMDLTDIKSALDMGGLSGMLGDLGTLKGSMGPALDGAAGIMKTFVEFLQSLPDKLSNAFSTPLSACSAGPQALQDMLDKVEVLKKLDMNSLLDTLEKTKDSVSNMDTEAVKKPMEDFASSAAGPIDKLDKGVSAAKMCGGAGGALGAVKGMFG